MDALYDEHKLDLSKASAAIAAAEDAARHVKGVRSETLVAELVQLRAEIRRLRLKSEEGDEDAEEEAESLGGVPATSSRSGGVEFQPEEVKQTSRQTVDKVQQQLTELCNKSVHADDEMEELLSRQREAEEREKALLQELAALQIQLEELQSQVEEANQQVAMTVKSGHEQALALEKTQKECDTLRQECQRLSANSNNHADCMPQEKSTQTPPAIQEANGALGRGAHPARVASGGEMGADGEMCARAEGGLDGAECVEGIDMDGLKNVQELREQLHKAQEELEEERKRNKGQDSGGEGGGEELEELRRRLDEERKKMMDLEEQLQKAQVNL